MNATAILYVIIAIVLADYLLERGLSFHWCWPLAWRAIPDCRQARELLPTLVFRERMEGKKRERELRILNAFDVESCCR